MSIGAAQSAIEDPADLQLFYLAPPLLRPRTAEPKDIEAGINLRASI